MQKSFRKIERRDVEGLFILRISVRENPMTLENLAGMGITPKSTAEALGDPLDGYLCEIEGRIAGFAMADIKSGELAVIAVHSDYEGKGIGRKLLSLTEGLLWASGHGCIWLWTSADRTTRAIRLYTRAGWTETKVVADRLYFKKWASQPSKAPGKDSPLQ